MQLAFWRAVIYKLYYDGMAKSSGNIDEKHAPNVIAPNNDANDFYPRIIKITVMKTNITIL